MTVDWPYGFDRTKETSRSPNHDYSVTLATAVEDLETELDRMNVDQWRVSFGNNHAKSNGMPLHNANPDDPSFVLYWTKRGVDHAVAADGWSRLRDNVREVGLWLKETRKRANRLVQTAQTEYAAARLPPGDTSAQEATPLGDSEDMMAWSRMDAHDVLQIPEDAAPKTIIEAFQARVKEAHPDNGGSMEELHAVRDARNHMMMAGRGISPQ